MNVSQLRTETYSEYAIRQGVLLANVREKRRLKNVFLGMAFIAGTVVILIVFGLGWVARGQSDLSTAKAVAFAMASAARDEAFSCKRLQPIFLQCRAEGKIK